jgi:hypothetical protein
MTTRLIAFLGAVAVLAGCATAEPVPLPNGDTGFAIKCGNMADCYKKAAELCGGKYEIVGQAGGAISGGSGAGGVVTPTYSLTVGCPAGSGSAPK